MNFSQLSRFPPKFQKAGPLLVFRGCRTVLRMIGNPEVTFVGLESHCRAPGLSHKAGLLENDRPKPFSSGACNKNGFAVEVKPEQLREAAPEMPDWDFELKAKLLIVEGNIGVGKTTLTRKLADKLQYRIFLEPTTENPYLGM